MSPVVQGPGSHNPGEPVSAPVVNIEAEQAILGALLVDNAIADRIQDLVADEFIVVAKPAFVEDIIAADHDGVAQRTALGQTGGPKLFHVVQDAEGQGGAQVLASACVDDAEGHGPLANVRNVKMNY